MERALRAGNPIGIPPRPEVDRVQPPMTLHRGLHTQPRPRATPIPIGVARVARGGFGGVE
jgi:hypothetical protein